MSADDLPKLDMPKRPDMSKLPVRVDRDRAAELLTEFYFRTSPRTLERWPLEWQILNGKAHCETGKLFRVADEMVAAAPVIRGGQRRQAAAVTTTTGSA